MKKYEIIQITNWWSSSRLKKNAEEVINKKANEGYQIISVSFGINIWMIPSAYITICM